MDGELSVFSEFPHNEVRNWQVGSKCRISFWHLLVDIENCVQLLTKAPQICMLSSRLKFYGRIHEPERSQLLGEQPLRLILSAVRTLAANSGYFFRPRGREPGYLHASDLALDFYMGNTHATRSPARNHDP